MTKNRTDPLLVVPVLLAVVGIGAFATAIIIVPSMVKQLAAIDVPGRSAPAAVTPDQATPQAQVPEQPVANPTAQPEPDGVEEPAPVAGPGQAPAAVTPPAEEKVEAPQAPPGEEKVAAQPDAPAAPVGGDGPWQISLSADTYEIDSSEDSKVDAIIAALNADATRKVKLTGVNHPNKSRKRAMKAAKIVKDRVVADVGIGKHRVLTRGEQDPGVDGVLVKAELTGGAK